MDIRARKTKSFQNLRFRNDFNIKTSKTICFFSKKCQNFIPRALSESHKTNCFSTFMLHELARATFSCSNIIKFQESLAKNKVMRARKTKSFQNLRFRNDFNIKTSKTQWFFKKIVKMSSRALLRICRKPTTF